MEERVRPGPSGWSYPSTCSVPCTVSRMSSSGTLHAPPCPLPDQAASGQMYTSPTRVPSGWGSANAMTSVSPRRPVTRRLSRRMTGAARSVSSTRAPRAPSHARTRRAARSSLGRGPPGRRDAAHGTRIVDAIVIHPADDAHELAFHLIDLLQRHRRLVQLAGVELGAHDMVDALLDLLRRQVLQHTQGGLDRVGEHRDRRFARVRFGPGIRVIGGLERPAVAALLGAIEEVGDLGGAVVLRNERGDGVGEPRLAREREAVRDVGLDDLGRLVGLEPVVRIVAARLVFDEVLRVLDLPDVVVITPDAPE